MTAAAVNGTPDNSMPADSTHSTPRHDPLRIRGPDLKRSLRFITIAWLFGAFWMYANTGTTSTKLATYLGADDFIFGILGAVPFIATLMQIPGSIFTEWLGHRRKLFLWTVTFHRGCYLLVALLPWFLPAGHRISALVMALILLISNASAHFGTPAWVHWMADLVPERIRGKYWAGRARLGIIVVALTALFVGSVLDLAEGGPSSAWLNRHWHPPIPWLMVLISVILFFSAICGMLDIQSFHFVAEPQMRRQPRLGWVAALAVPLKDRDFRWYIAYLSCFVFAVGFVGTFMWVYVVDLFKQITAARPGSWLALHNNLAAYLMLLVVANLGAFMAYPIWGRLIDRVGRKPIIFVSSAAHTVQMLAWVFISSQNIMLGFVAGLFGGFVFSGQEIANFNMILAFNRKGGPGYQAVSAVLMNVCGALGSILAGTVAETLHHFETNGVLFSIAGHAFNRYNMLFVICVLVKLIADFVLLPRVNDTQAKATRYAIRFIAGSVYDNVGNAVMMPLRMALRANETFRPWRRRKP
jgi:MFS family permease